MRNFAISFLLFVSASLASACEVRDARVCAIRDTVKQLVLDLQPAKFSPDTNTNNIAAQYEWVIGAPSLVHIGDTQFLSDEELFYLVAHELAHVHHNHGRQSLEHVAHSDDKGLPDLPLLKKYLSVLQSEPSQLREVNHKQEFEADEFAVRLMVRLNMDPVKAMRGVLKNAASSYNYPARRHRMDRAQALVAQLRDTAVASAQSQQ